MFNAHLKFETIIIEDSSNLLYVLPSIGKDVRYINLGEQAGLGAAIKTGIRVARYEDVLLLPADMSYELEIIPRLCASAAPLVIGSKYHGRAIRQRPLTVKLVSRLFHLWLALRYGVHEDATGIALYRKSVIAPLLDECPSDDVWFYVELIRAAHRAGISITEIPAEVHDLRKRGITRWLS
jgi:glycosyltransferase involved in cell wall biosynthesis